MSSFHITQLTYDQMKVEHKSYNYLLASVFCRKHSRNCWIREFNHKIPSNLAELQSWTANQQFE